VVVALFEEFEMEGLEACLLVVVVSVVASFSIFCLEFENSKKLDTFVLGF